MKCDLCDKTEGVKVIIAGGEVTDRKTEGEFRRYVENYLNKAIIGFLQLCPKHFSYVTKCIIELRKSR